MEEEQNSKAFQGRKGHYTYDLASLAKYLEVKTIENIISFAEVKMIIV